MVVNLLTEHVSLRCIIILTVNVTFYRMLSTRRTRSRTKVVEASAAVEVEESTAPNVELNAALSEYDISEAKAERLEKALELVARGSSLRKASKECSITRHLIRVLVSYAVLHY